MARLNRFLPGAGCAGRCAAWVETAVFYPPGGNGDRQIDERHRHCTGEVAVAVLLGWLLVPAVAEEIVQMGRMVTELAGNAKLAEKESKWLSPELWQHLKSYLTRPEIKDFFKDINI